MNRMIPIAIIARILILLPPALGEVVGGAGDEHSRHRVMSKMLLAPRYPIVACVSVVFLGGTLFFSITPQFSHRTYVAPFSAWQNNRGFLHFGQSAP